MSARRTGTVERRYKTERGFRAALKRLWPRVITWWGEDHAWVLVLRGER